MCWRDQGEEKLLSLVSCHTQTDEENCDHPKDRSGKRDKKRTIMILGKSKRVPRPHSNEFCAVTPKGMKDHVVDAVWLRRAPYHDV